MTSTQLVPRPTQSPSVVRPGVQDVLNPDEFFGLEVAIPEPTIKSPADRAREWTRAFDQWLAELNADATRSAYQRAWDDLLNFTGKQSWALQSPDIRDWIADLQVRPLAAYVAKGLIKKGYREDRYGYAPSTVAQMRAAISSFFTFVMFYYTITDIHGAERPLHDGINPARAVRIPKYNSAAQADYLTAEAVFELLKAIDQTTIQGKRDFALFLGYVFTGRRNTEWRTLQWGNLIFKEGKIIHIWDGKGKKQVKNDLAQPVWLAIKAYLDAAGRKNLKKDDYIFISHSDNATRLPTVSRHTWNRNRPLHRGTVGDKLKKYARLAGLDANRVHPHIFRHTAAMLRKAGGDSIETICEILGHSNSTITRHYLNHMESVPDPSWRNVAAQLKLDLIQPKGDQSENSENPALPT